MALSETGRARIIDANLNRIGEGLRVLEDCARLILNDPELTSSLKQLRHRLIERDLSFNTSLLDARDAAGDVGSNIRAPGQDEAKELPLVIVANSRRVQESLRVIEELAKSPGEPALDPSPFQDCRFQLYTIERSLVSGLLRQQKRERLSGRYAMLDVSAVNARQAVELAIRAVAAGAAAIELKCPAKDPLAFVEGIRKICTRGNVLLIISERADLAAAGSADGVRLQHGIMPLRSVRKILPFDKIMGYSVGTIEEALAAQKEGADYVLVSGPVHAGALQCLKRAVHLPVVSVAFGNAISNNMAEIKATDVDAASRDI